MSIIDFQFSFVKKKVGFLFATLKEQLYHKQSNLFSFHPKCKKLELTHLCFADDLFTFSKGDLDSIIGIYKVMQVFYSFSGL